MNDEQVKKQAGKPKYNRKLLLLILLMFLIVSQVVVLAVNSGFINQSPEMVSVVKPEITLEDLKAVNDDLNEVIKSLNDINASSELKKNQVEIKKVDTKKVEIKPVLVPSVPVVAEPVIVKRDKKNIKPKNIKPEQKITETKKTALVKKLPAATVVTPKPKEMLVEKSIVAEVKSAYIKHDSKGTPLDDKTEQWTCVQDTKNGLMWEVKTNDETMRDSENLYSWFDPDNKLKGITDGGRCKGDADCDTHAYVEAMNEQNYCGYGDWRIPTREEMMGLVSYGDDKIKINTGYFPQTLPSWYWTAESNKSRPEFAWYVYFKNGMSLNDLKENPKHIRLVRDQPSS
ncbi:MAG: DUF1566 domain-containing protein [Gammaproteobacteria bacterium]|nr:DUF1566 domain-containing protein [Gammaproteobacteria bacterium]